MIYLGLFTAGNSVFYAANFHNEAGTLEDPASPEAQIRDPSGTWSALTTPVKQNGKTGHFGGIIDTTGFAAGQYAIRLAGTVTTGKAQAAEFTFTVDAAIKSVANDVGITQAGADKVWGSAARKLTGPDNITSNNLKLTLDGSGNVTLKSGTHTGATVPNVTTTTTATNVVNLTGEIETGFTYAEAIRQIALQTMLTHRGAMLVPSFAEWPTVTATYSQILGVGASIEVWAADPSAFYPGVDTADDVLVGTLTGSGWVQNPAWPVGGKDMVLYLRQTAGAATMNAGVLTITVTSLAGVSFTHKVKLPGRGAGTASTFMGWDRDGNVLDNFGLSTVATYGYFETNSDGRITEYAPGLSPAEQVSALGLTQARAARLDNLDAAVSSRSVFDPESDLLDSNGASGWTWKQAFRLVFAFLLGERSGGGRAGNKSFKVPGGIKTRVVMATDANGNSAASHTFDHSDS
ncbi:hypothetical protein EPN96_06610 [bacterium]|nr:MAG: hypothetical protein EPN96_06610 [bacterium]